MKNVLLHLPKGYMSTNDSEMNGRESSAQLKRVRDNSNER